MSYLSRYIALLESEDRDVARSVEKTIVEIVPQHIEKFSFREHISGLLLGNVQSGKTGQMLGLAAAAADHGFDLFILLTTDNVQLQEQTFGRTVESLEGFNVCSEDDEIRFARLKMRKPTLVVLKKNTRVLDRWKNNLISSGFCTGRPIFIIDDEGDAASLNTKVNNEEQSAINSHLQQIKSLCTSSFFLQVTATPQPILLQTKFTGFKPSFVYYFEPGEKYKGGKFYYPAKPSFTTRFTDEDELTELLVLGPDDPAPEGLTDSLLTFLVTSAHIIESGYSQVCNFLIHPSVRIADQEKVADILRALLNDILTAVQDGELEIDIRRIWEDLHSSKPELLSFDELARFIHGALENEKYRVVVMNSQSKDNTDVSQGMNIIIGGNTLGRGVTFPVLQTVYYCRKAKTPQADTFWQHCRMFGYDRDHALMRIYIPASVYSLFSDISSSNEALINQIRNNPDIDNITLLHPPGTRPTRANVVDQSALSIIPGGKSFFPRYPAAKNLFDLDNLLQEYDDDSSPHIISPEFAQKLLTKTKSEVADDWSNEAFISAIEAIKHERANSSVALIIRRRRKLSKLTGTMLSETDRLLGNSIRDKTVVVFYRNEGGSGWNEDELPIWIPNVKLPNNINFYASEV